MEKNQRLVVSLVGCIWHDETSKLINKICEIVASSEYERPETIDIRYPDVQAKVGHT